MEDLLKGFVIQLLEAQGALCEEVEGGCDVLLPPELARRLGCPESLQLSFDPLKENGRQRILYGSELLDRLLELAGNLGLSATYTVSGLPAKSERLVREMGQKFSLPNAKGTLLDSSSAYCPYLILNFKYVALSDERKEGMIRVTVNESSLASFDELEEVLDPEAHQPGRPFGGSPPRPLEEVYRKGCRVAQARIARELKEFEESMNRRLQRDVQRLEDYYLDLAREMEGRIRKRGLQGPEKADLVDKIRATEAELERKVEDLWNKYSIRVRVQWVNSCRIFLPVLQGRYEILRRKERREERVFWNPWLRQIEPLACEGCLENGYTFYLCDRLHRVCPQCFAPCRDCGKRLCPLCLPRERHVCASQLPS
ncbi:MAG: hypothetical protein HYY20_04990 [Candidatus Tectomicrobia bacterium]|uniref:Uncharacterized protein n=1 Tax=Tectimicrobiota bacterium TaxID=2528274 RepID=A0A932CMV5_UNCTE|nr:hypothetical protein [Candidatus Tectomicrobia bacterium]